MPRNAPERRREGLLAYLWRTLVRPYLVSAGRHAQKDGAWHRPPGAHLVRALPHATARRFGQLDWVVQLHHRGWEDTEVLLCRSVVFPPAEAQAAG